MMYLIVVHFTVTGLIPKRNMAGNNMPLNEETLDWSGRKLIDDVVGESVPNFLLRGGKKGGDFKSVSL